MADVEKMFSDFTDTSEGWNIWGLQRYWKGYLDFESRFHDQGERHS